MASLPSQHPTLSLHLADDSLTPLITSSRSRAHLESLTSLATSALTSQAAAQRVGMGDVERIMVEYPAPAAAALVLQSYLHVPRCHGSINTTTTAAAAAITTSDISRTTRGEDDGDNDNNNNNSNSNSNSNKSNHSTNSNGGRHGHGHDKVNQNSEETTSWSRSRTDAGAAAASSGKGASRKASDRDNDAGEEDLHAPRLIGVVVAGTPQEAGEAKKAAARLERVGREFQSQWSLSSN